MQSYLGSLQQSMSAPIAAMTQAEASYFQAQQH
jgi:hypothetical protein